MDYRKVLLAVCPHGKPSIIDGFGASMDDAISVAELTNARRLGMFIGQCAHESDGLKTLTEYASGKAYNGRTDLGNVVPGDGPRFKGRGLIELTGRANYTDAGHAIGINLVSNPWMAAEWPAAAKTAAWFWNTRALNQLADASDETTAITRVTEKVNGGINGLSSRVAYTRKALAALSDLKGTLISTAAEETKKAATKTKQASGAVIAAGSGASAAAHPATQAAAGNSGLLVILLLCAAVLGLAIALGLSVRKHRLAVAALTEAAKGA